MVSRFTSIQTSLFSSSLGLFSDVSLDVFASPTNTDCVFFFIFLSAEKTQNNLDFLSLSRRTERDSQIEQIEGLVAIPSVSPDSSG